MCRRILATLVIFSFLLQTACSKKQNQEAPKPPCTIGVNSKSCQIEIADQSMWVRQYHVFSQADASQKPQVEKQVTVIQQFKIRRDGSKIWRRSSTISDLKGISQTMMIGGKILDIDKEKLSLSIDRSTCEGVNSGPMVTPATDSNGGRDLYYRRHGAQLELRTQPFPEPTHVSSGRDPVSQIFGAIIGSVLDATVGNLMRGMVDGMGELMANMLTFGLLRDQLKAGAGTFTLADPEKFEVAAPDFTFGQTGCYAVRGPGLDEFVVSPNQTVDF